MNYFGLFFTFMIPGMVLGLMGALSLREMALAKRRKAQAARLRARRQAELQARRRKQALYVSTLECPRSRAA